MFSLSENTTWMPLHRKMEQKITPDSRLVICKKLPNGSIDHSIIQSLEQWQRGHRNFELIRHGYADELLGILTEDLGLVSVDENGLLRSRILIVNSEEEVRGQSCESLVRSQKR